MRFLLALLMTIGCGKYDKGAADTASPHENQTSNLSSVNYAEIRNEVLTQYQCTSCHQAFGTYAGLMATGLVAPGDPQGSKIYRQVQTKKMPPSEPKVSAHGEALLLEWITSGAPEY